MATYGGKGSITSYDGQGPDLRNDAEKTADFMNVPIEEAKEWLVLATQASRFGESPCRLAEVAKEMQLYDPFRFRFADFGVSCPQLPAAAYNGAEELRRLRVAFPDLPPVQSSSSLSEVVDMLSKVCRYPMEQLRVMVEVTLETMQIKQPHQTMQIWPCKHRCKDMYATIPGLRSFLGPRLVSSACALTAAGIPAGITELVMNTSLHINVPAAPLCVLISTLSSGLADPFEEVCPNLNDWRTMPKFVVDCNTEDGLPEGARVPVQALVFSDSDPFSNPRDSFTLQVPSCITLVNFRKLVVQRLARDDELYSHVNEIYFRDEPDSMKYGVTLEDHPSFRPDEIPALQVQLEEHNQLLHRVRGRPFLVDEVSVVAEAAVEADDWSCLSVADILNASRTLR